MGSQFQADFNLGMTSIKENISDVRVISAVIREIREQTSCQRRGVGTNNAIRTFCPPREEKKD